MDLTRRDAVAALAAAGVGSAAIERVRSNNEQTATMPSAAMVKSLVAVAEVVYPSEIEVTEEFIETLVAGRTAERTEYGREVEAGLRSIDEAAERRFGRGFRTLPLDDRERLLRELGLARVEPNPDGSDVARIRYYVVNELLYSLYTSPTGGRLLGNPNPPGHPGGLEAYQRDP